jgi:hypothetical protein
MAIRIWLLGLMIEWLARSSKMKFDTTRAIQVTTPHETSHMRENNRLLCVSRMISNTMAKVMHHLLLSFLSLVSPSEISFGWPLLKNKKMNALNKIMIQ